MPRSPLRPAGLALAFLLLALTGARGGAADSANQPKTPLQISMVQVSQVSESSATVSWQTNRQTTDQVSYGVDSPVLWTPVSSNYTTSHTVHLTGLTFNTGYTLHLLSADQNGATAKAQVSLTTSVLGQVQASSKNGVIELDGSPVLPIAVWATCNDAYSRLLAIGINMFEANSCDENQFSSLGGQALSVGDISHRLTDEPSGFIGWYYTDEWDSYLDPDVTQDQLGPRVNVAGRLTFLNLSSHSWSGAAKFPGKDASWYDKLKALPDVIGLDVYPLTSFCSMAAISDVFAAASEFAATGKPSFQWIEARAMDCGSTPDTTPTPDTVRAETWLALIGGAHMIGYFPPDISSAIANQIAAQDKQITALAPALLQPAQSVSVAAPAGSSVYATARVLNGALYVFMANGDPDATTKVRVTVPGLHGRTLTTYDRSHSIDPVLDTFTDTLAPLATRVYIATPDGS